MKTYTTNSGIKLIQLIMGRRCNCFLIDDSELKVLVDTSKKSDRKKLLQQIERYYPSLSKIDYLILTHTHYDHVQNATFIVEKFKPKVIVHQLESTYLQNGFTPLPNGTSWYPRLMVWLGKQLLPNLPKFNPIKPDIEIEQEYSLANTIKIISTPGHTAGSISVIIDNEFALIGDTMFGIFKHTIYPPFANLPNQLPATWCKLLNTKCQLFFPSHGKPIPFETVDSEIKRIQ